MPPKKNKNEAFIIHHPDVPEEEVLKLANRPAGFDDGQPKIVYNTEGLLEAIKKDAEMVLFEVEAEGAPGDNQIKFIEDIKKKIVTFENNKKDLEKSLGENINKIKKIKNTLEIQRLEGVIRYLENKIDEISKYN